MWFGSSYFSLVAFAIDKYKEIVDESGQQIRIKIDNIRVCVVPVFSTASATKVWFLFV